MLKLYGAKDEYHSIHVYYCKLNTANFDTKLLNKQTCNLRKHLPRPCHHLVNSTKHNVVLDFGLLAPLCENTTSPTKPEVHNVLYCRPRKTEPWPQIIILCTYASGQTNRQTDRHKNRYADAVTAISMGE